MNPPLTGGCLCGRTRYALDQAPLQTTVCHCADCRKSAGAPFMVWSFFRPGSLSWSGQEPKVIQIAERIRSFCPDCGSPLTFFDPQIPDLFEVSTCTLDDPGAHPPLDQCWTADRIPWCHSLNELPGSPETGPLPAD